MGRSSFCDNINMKKGPWSPEEDGKLKEFIEKYGTGGNWIALPQKVGLKRCGKSCRLRWLNYLRPNIKHGNFSQEEDRVICSLYAKIGSRWSIIAAHSPGRTDNDIKHYWNTKLKKKLMDFIQPSSSNNQIIKSSNLLFPPTSTLQTTFQPQSQASILSLLRDTYLVPIPLVQPKFMYNNNNMINFQLGTNNQYSYNFHDQSLLNPIQAISCCSSSDVLSCNQISYGNDEIMCQIPFEETQKFTLDNYCSTWADYDQKANGYFGSNFQSSQFQYDHTNIEEVKELNSSSSGNGWNNINTNLFFFNDENKTNV